MGKSHNGLGKEREDNFVVVDGHCDTIQLFSGKYQYEFSKNNITGHIDLPRLRQGGVKLQFFAICPEQRFIPWGALRRTLVFIKNFYQAMGENKDEIQVVLDKKSLDSILQGDKLGAILTLEGGEALEGELNILHCLFFLGVRGLGLTWNHRNALADGVDVGKAAGGLTKFGREVVREMERLGMLIDAAHLAPRSFYDLLENTAGPVVVSHANAAGLCPHRRNLDDGQLRALQEQGGVVGLSFYPPFVKSNGTAGIEDLLDHFCYIADRFGTDLLAIGSDYDGIEETVKGLEDVSRLSSLRKGLLSRGFSQEETARILGGNFLRVLRATFKD